MTTCFQIIDGNTERSIMVVKGEAADLALNKLADARGPEGITKMIESGEMEIVEYNGEHYFNLYI